MAYSFDADAYAARVNEAFNRLKLAQGLGQGPVAGRPGYPMQQEAPQQPALSPGMSGAIAKGIATRLGAQTAVGSFPSVFSGGAAATQAAPLTTGGVTPWLNSGGYAGIGEAGALTPGAATPTAGLGFAPYAGAAGAALGAYGVYNALKNNDSKAGAMSGAALGGGLAAAAPLIGLGPVGWGGLALAAALGGAGGFGITEAFGHKGTKEYQKERDDQLRNAGLREEFISSRNSGDPGWKDPNNWQRQQGLITDKGVLTAAGQKDAASNWGAQGILKAIGNDYFDKYNEKQRYQITQAAIDNNLLKGDMGDVIVKDDDLLRSLISGAITNNDYGSKYDAWKSSSSGLAAAGASAPPSSVRSKTSSPGISKDGKRISY